MVDVPDEGRAGSRAFRRGALTRSRSAGRCAKELDYAVVDVETTGLDPDQGARVCEIAVVRMRGDGTVTRELNTLVNPGVPVTGQEFHSIGASDVIGAPQAADLVGILAELFSGAVVVGHKLDFEGAFLAAEFVPAGLPADLPGLCTLRTLRSQVDLDRYALPRASHTLTGHWPSGQHTALGDARACAQLLAELLYNAPGELRYVGPDPKRLTGAESGETVRLKPRTPVARGLRLSAVREGAARPLAPWPSRWRPLEFDPALCGGRFGAVERGLATQDARRRAVTRDALAASAALAGVAASTAAARMLLRRLG
ncbi:DNA polymerase III subunit epsilon [Nocardiopsis gilva YIM 90087]|uniref:DNA polymerase III subunit epsilon n=1 Tax=Nocardiopsis gilva YIM 90087 TaxID=1235441 RepID=A0A223S3U5_9ACTN|nr:3'-5' exonuclease [Nocardiopsis gilva]ASU82800.1 DNA polymerase III subunit epsilon [Nocardiopsis gilva YIM 90087]